MVWVDVKHQPGLDGQPILARPGHRALAGETARAGTSKVT